MRKYTFKKFLEQRDPNLYDESFVDMATAGMEAGVSGVGAGLWDFVKKLSTNSLKARLSCGHRWFGLCSRENGLILSVESKCKNVHGSPTGVVSRILDALVVTC